MDVAGSTTPDDKPRTTGATVAEQCNGHADASSVARRLALDAGPSVVAVAVMLGFIFGGCCSNVCDTAAPRDERRGQS